MRSVYAIGVVGVLAAAGSDSGCERIDTGKSTKVEMEQTELNHQRLVKAVPAPRIGTSQERLNLSKRLTRFNTDSKVSYIYLVSYGKVMAFYPVKGKVSSVNSLLTTPIQLVRAYGGDHRQDIPIPSPDLDGSYGENGDAIFFFTTDDTYVEWNGEYMLCDKPLKLTTPPALVLHVEDE